MESLTTSKEAELNQLRTQVKTLQAAAPPPAPKKIVLTTTNQRSRHRRRRRYQDHCQAVCNSGSASATISATEVILVAFRAGCYQQGH